MLCLSYNPQFCPSTPQPQPQDLSITVLQTPMLLCVPLRLTQPLRGNHPPQNLLWNLFSGYKYPYILNTFTEFTLTSYLI